jgi:hypothetical protein
VFAYLGIHHNAIVVFDPTYPAVDMGTFMGTFIKTNFLMMEDTLMMEPFRLSSCGDFNAEKQAS